MCGKAQSQKIFVHSAKSRFVIITRKAPSWQKKPW